MRPRAQQRQTVSVRLGQEERRSSLALAVLQGVRQRLPFALRQKHDAEHGEDGERGEDDVVQEVAAVILELHEGRGGHANAARCQHQTETAASDHGWHNFTGEEGTEHGKSLREQQAHHREDQHQAALEILCEGEQQQRGQPSDDGGQQQHSTPSKVVDRHADEDTSQGSCYHTQEVREVEVVGVNVQVSGETVLDACSNKQSEAENETVLPDNTSPSKLQD